MKANELLKKLGHKILGKKLNAQAAGIVATASQVPPAEKTQEMPVLDGLGAIQLHEYWRN